MKCPQGSSKAINTPIIKMWLTLLVIMSSCSPALGQSPPEDRLVSQAQVIKNGEAALPILSRATLTEPTIIRSHSGKIMPASDYGTGISVRDRRNDASGPLINQPCANRAKGVFAAVGGILPAQRFGDKSEPSLHRLYSTLPLSFEANRGQAGHKVKYISRGSGYTVMLAQSEAALVLGKIVSQDRRIRIAEAPEQLTVKISLPGSNPNAALTGRKLLPGQVNYFIGDDPHEWRTSIPTYAEIRQSDVYPGIDLTYYGNQRQLEYDFTVAPGADASVIQLAYDGADDIRIDAAGDLLLQTKLGTIRQRRPNVYQQIEGAPRSIAGTYVITGRHRIGFRLGEYDKSKPLVIDPVLVYSSYLGGSGEETAGGIAIDPSGNIYIAGTTTSADYPVAGGVQGTNKGKKDVFVTKLNPTSNAVIYSSYLGGAEDDSGYAVAIDSSGNVYIAGETASSDFPTKNSQPRYRFTEGFVAKLNPAGNNLVYSTYWGDNSVEVFNAIAVDSSGNAWAAGWILISFGTSGVDLDFWVARFDPAGKLLGGYRIRAGSGQESANAIVVDSAGNAYIAGEVELGSNRVDAAVVKVTSSGNVASTFLFGGAGYDTATGIAMDSKGSFYVTGSTDSADFPTIGAVQSKKAGDTDAFIAKLDSSAAKLLYSSYLGGSAKERGDSVAVDPNGIAYITGSTKSLDFPTVNPLQGSNGGGQDVFVAAVNAAGTALIHSGYVGGAGDDDGAGIALDSSGIIYIIGSTKSGNFPISSAAYQKTLKGSQNAFVAKISLAQQEYLLPQVVNGTFSGGSYRMTFVIVNNNDQPANFSIKLTDDNGAPLSVTIPNLGSKSEFPLTLGAGATAMYQTDGSGILQTGAARVTSAVPLGVSAIFSVYDGSGRFQTEAGVGTSAVATDIVIPVDTTGNFNTGVALFNPDNNNAELSLQLIDQSGQLTSRSSLSLGAGKHIARFISGTGQLFPLVTNFRGTMSITSTIPVAAVTLRENSVPLSYTSLPAVSRASGKAQISLPHVANGTFSQGGFRTTFILFNMSATAATAVMTLTRDDGSPLSVRLVGNPAAASVFQVTLAAGASAFLETDGSGPLTAGSATIQATGGTIGATVIFTVVDLQGSFTTEAGVGDSAALTEMTLPVDIGDVTDTGVAIFNPSGSSASLQLRLRDASGATAGTTTLNLGSKNHTATFVSQLFAGKTNFRGSLAISSSGAAIAAVTLRQNTVPLTYTTLPVIAGIIR